LSLGNCHTSEILTNQRRIINRNYANGTIFYNGSHFAAWEPMTRCGLAFTARKARDAYVSALTNGIATNQKPDPSPKTHAGHTI
jgi:hypothetical protein